MVVLYTVSMLLTSSVPQGWGRGPGRLSTGRRVQGGQGGQGGLGGRGAPGPGRWRGPRGPAPRCPASPGAPSGARSLCNMEHGHPATRALLSTSHASLTRQPPCPASCPCPVPLSPPTTPLATWRVSVQLSGHSIQGCCTQPTPLQVCPSEE